MDLDYAQLAQRVLRPDRPQLAQARAAVAQTAEPRAAWEVLATRGLIPPDWVGDPRRGFVAHLPPEPWMPPEDVSELPASDAQCIAMGADPGGCAAAEHLAREFCARVAPPLTGIEQVVWWIGRDWRASHLPAWSTLDRIRMVLFPRGADTPASIAARDADRRLHAAAPPAGPRTERVLAYHAGPLVGLDAAWRVAAREGLQLDGTRLAERPNPFAPLLEMLSLGYALHAVVRPTLVLVAPEPDDDPPPTLAA